MIPRFHCRHPGLRRSVPIDGLSADSRIDLDRYPPSGRSVCAGLIQLVTRALLCRWEESGSRPSDIG